MAQAQAKTDFSGTWKMDPAKSDFGHGPKPTYRLDIITHNDPNFKDKITQRNEKGEGSWEMNYTTDGKPCHNMPEGKPFDATAHWEGDALVVDSEGALGGHVTIKDRYSLSPDGKTMTIRRHLTRSIFSTDQTVVLDKQ